MKKVLILLLLSTNCYSKHLTVFIKGYAFEPKVITIRKGDSIRWLNIENMLHNINEVNGLFKSSFLSKNQDFIYKFNKKGIFHYFCIPHKSMGMNGTIIVK